MNPDFASAFPKMEEEPQPEQVQQQAEEPQPASAPISQTLLDKAMAATMERDATLTSAMADMQMQNEQFKLHQRYARLFAQSGAFVELKGMSESQAIGLAVTKIMLGASMGMTPAEAMQSVDVIKGRMAVSAQAQAARMARAGYSWEIAQLNEEGCVLLPMKNGKHILENGAPARVSFTIADAKRAKLIKENGGYETYPRNMLFARAISNMRRWYAPETLNGADVPTSEEVREFAQADAPKAPVFPVAPPKTEGK